MISPPISHRTAATSNRDLLNPTDHFVDRHIGPRPEAIVHMLQELGLRSLDALIAETVPAAIMLDNDLTLDTPRSESEILTELRAIAAQNQLYRSFIGMGYYDCTTPPVILRNIFENPGWYTQYTPYQAEIAQGRLEALDEFPDHDHRPDRHGNRQRLAAGRGHGRRRSHDAVPAAAFAQIERHQLLCV
jgi:hypothetical protein